MSSPLVVGLYQAGLIVGDRLRLQASAKVQPQCLNPPGKDLSLVFRVLLLKYVCDSGS